MISQINGETESTLGVSGVIGVILMIALTIILATVVGTFAFDLAGDVLSQPPQAGVSFNEEYDQFYGIYVVEAVLNSAPNVERVELRGDVLTAADSDCQNAIDDAGATYSEEVSKVGSSATVCVPSTGGEVRAVGITEDGSAQVISTHSVSGE